MATLRERLRARREAERRGLRSFTIGLSEDDLRVIAKHGYEGVLSTDPISRRKPSASSSPTCSPLVAQATALRQLQRRFSEGVTTVATSFQSSGK
jgi:hypothetical protein